jgi:CHAT domain-containing protein
MRIRPSRATLLLLLALAATRPAPAQADPSQRALAPGIPLHLDLRPGEETTLQIAAPPHTLQVVELHFTGGLLGIQSAETTRRVLDLGRGGSLFYAVQAADSGLASLTLTSAEHLRAASLDLQLATENFTPDQRNHLHTAGIVFAAADSARRHLPRAPDAPSALKLYDQAAAEATAAGDPSLARWALAQKARFLLYQRSSFTATRDLLLSAAALPAEQDEAVQALILKTLSSCDYFLGDLPQAATQGEQALALYRRTGDLYWQGIVLGNLIADYAGLGRDADATAAAREALTDAEQTQDTAGVVFSLTELANLYRQEGALQPAFESFREAHAWAETKDIRYAPLIQADIEKAQGQFDLDLGLWAEAEDQLRRCLHDATPNSASALEAQGLLARAIAGDPDRRGNLHAALAQYDSALAMARKLQLAPEETTLLIDRSAVLLDAHQPAAALEDARQAALLAQASASPNLRIEAALAQGAACFQACNSPSQAVPFFQQALALATSKQPDRTAATPDPADPGQPEQQARAHAGLARVHAALGQDQLALDQLAQAFPVFERSRASFASHDLAASYFAERRASFALATGLALRLDRLHPNQGFREQAFRFSEQARARAMLDALGQPTSPSNTPVPPAVQLRIAENDRQIDLHRAQLLTSSDPTEPAAALKALYREREELQAEQLTAGSAPSQNQAQSFARIASLAEVQQSLLDPHTALLLFTPGEQRVYRWLITRASVHIDALPANLPSQLAPLQSALSQRQTTPTPGEDAAQFAARSASFVARLNRSLARAGTLLLPQTSASIHSLLIVAAPPLQAIPWAALKTSCSGPLATHPGFAPCFAIERYALAMEPSASTALALAQRPASPATQTALILSDPLPFQASALPRWRELAALPGTRRESDAIARFTAQPHILRGPEATPENLRAALASHPAVLHLAAHTLLVANHPELSGIALSPGSAPNFAPVHAPSHASIPSQSILWLRDIPRLQAPPLVVLSGCATQGPTLAGDELNTLTQAFFHAGAQQVVASLWEVDDDATAALMAAFYRNLRHLTDHAPLADWAAFVLSGLPTHSGSAKSFPNREKNGHPERSLARSWRQTQSMSTSVSRSSGPVAGHGIHLDPEELHAPRSSPGSRENPVKTAPAVSGISVFPNDQARR